MALDITFLGHSGFIFGDGEHTLVVDPFLTGNAKAVHQPGDIQCDVIALTHGHADHVGDTLAIAKQNDAKLIAPFELCNYLSEQGISKSEPANPGGRIYTDFGYVAFTPAIHSSSYEGQYMGVACGLVISMGGVKVYHTGDTALFSDMQMIGEVAKPNIACICCGDRYTMGPKLAAQAAELIAAPYAIPIHHSTFPALTSDLSEFTPSGVQVKEMQPGETWHFDAGQVV